MEGHQNIFHEYPVIGFIATALLAIAGEVAAVAPWDYPPVVMHTAQMIAWLSAFGMFLIAVHGWFKNNFKKRLWKR